VEAGTSVSMSGLTASPPCARAAPSSPTPARPAAGATAAVADAAYKLLTGVFLVCLALIAMLTAAGLAANANALESIYGNLMVISYLSAVYINWESVAVHCFRLLQLGIAANGTYVDDPAANINATVAWALAADMHLRSLRIREQLLYLRDGNRTARVPARFSGPADADIFTNMIAHATVTAQAAVNVSIAVQQALGGGSHWTMPPLAVQAGPTSFGPLDWASALAATNSTWAPVASAVGQILARDSLAVALPSLYVRMAAVSLAGFRDATTVQYAMFGIVMAVLMAAALVILWPLRRHLRCAHRERERESVCVCV
jgi:hypothetical protein